MYDIYQQSALGVKKCKVNTNVVKRVYGPMYQGSKRIRSGRIEAAYRLLVTD